MASRKSPFCLLLTLALVPRSVAEVEDGWTLARSLAPDTLVEPTRGLRSGRLSPDGTLIAYETRGADGKASIELVPAAGGVPRTLVPPGFDAGGPCFTRDSAALYFHWSKPGTEKIFVVPVAGGEPRQVTYGPGHDLHPSLSADGATLAFDSDREGSYDIWIQSLPGGDPVRLTVDPTPDFHPALSPDGRKVAFVSGRGGGWHLWARDVSGGSAYPLTRGSAADAHPFALPDGSGLVFDSDRSGTTGLWRVDWTGGGLDRVPTASPRASFPSVSGEGRTLVFTSEARGRASLEKTELPGGTKTAPVGAQAGAEPSRVGTPDPVPATGLGSEVRVMAFHPQSVPGGVGPEANVFAAFSEDVVPIGTWSQAVRMAAAGRGEVAVEALYNPALQRLELQPREPLAPGGKYRVELLPGKLAGRSGSPFSGFKWTFSRDDTGPGTEVVVATVASYDQFRVKGVLPRPDREGIRPDTKVAARFVGPFDPSSVDAKALVLKDEEGNPVAGELRMVEGDSTLVLVPYQALRPGVGYRAELSRTIRDPAGRTLTGRTEWGFRVAHGSPLTVVEVEPRGELGLESPITLRFNRPVDPATLGSGELVLEGGGIPHKGSHILDESGTLLLFQPHSRLPPGTELVLHLPAGLADREGHPVELAKPLRFATPRSASSQGADAILARHLPSRGGERSGDPMARLHETEGEPDADRVPRWVPAVLRGLKGKGYVDPALAAGLDGSGTLTRYRAALMVDSARQRTAAMSRHERAAVDRLLEEFGSELGRMGRVQTAAVPRAVAGG